ncbi:MAG: prepilin-type N-terminal cleavage/methylation domain-containing protein [SAR202 cluster bacterium]|nr:prepilin-type N-terminal cleavage/methylation domain-containing protein [SAR202 cluster bacterium]
MNIRVPRNTTRASRGLSLIEMVAALAITAMIVAPLATILNQFVFVPARWNAQLEAANNSRSAAFALAADARQAESFISGLEPDYGTFTWTDRNGPVTSTYSVLYYWDETSQTLMRQETADGLTVERPIAEGILTYDDIVLEFSDGALLAHVTSTEDRLTDATSQNTRIRASVRTSSASAQADPAAFRLAWDDFESADFAGGNGWLFDWSTSGNVSNVGTNSPQQGSRHMRLDGAANANNRGYADREVDLEGLSSIRVQFWAKVNGFEVDDTATMEVSTDGGVFQVTQTWVFADSDNTYRFYDIDLSPYTLSDDFFIAFRNSSNAGNDQLYVDNLQVVRVWE